MDPNRRPMLRTLLGLWTILGILSAAVAAWAYQTISTNRANNEVYGIACVIGVIAALFSLAPIACLALMLRGHRAGIPLAVASGICFLPIAGSALMTLSGLHISVMPLLLSAFLALNIVEGIRAAMTPRSDPAF